MSYCKKACPLYAQKRTLLGYSITSSAQQPQESAQRRQCPDVIIDEENCETVHVNSSDVVKTTGCGKHNDNQSQGDKDGPRILLHDPRGRCTGCFLARLEVSATQHYCLRVQTAYRNVRKSYPLVEEVA